MKNNELAIIVTLTKKFWGSFDMAYLFFPFKSSVFCLGAWKGQRWNSPFIKQFVVTNWSKEWPGSIVNETLKVQSTNFQSNLQNSQISRSDLQKCGISYFLPKTDHGCVFICLLFFFFLFPRGPRIQQVVLECRKKCHYNLEFKTLLFQVNSNNLNANRSQL